VKYCPLISDEKITQKNLQPKWLFIKGTPLIQSNDRLIQRLRCKKLQHYK
jgi:hypothetical protein